VKWWQDCLHPQVPALKTRQMSSLKHHESIKS
jgi:hypothetical protein